MKGTFFMKRYFLFLCLSFFGFSTYNAFAENIYKTYNNKRFEYSISYPKDILYPQGEAENGDGQKFLSKQGDTMLLVYGSHNIDEQTIKERYQQNSQSKPEENPSKIVTYRVLKENWFVVSGYVSGNLIFYQKTLLNNDQFKTFYFEYPETQKNLYDSIVKRLSTSFRG
jgi:hypothetical protein